MKNSKRILVVEDEEVIRALCRRILTRMGHEAAFADGFQEAMEKIGSLDNLGVLITDIRLPDGDGIEVIRRARAKIPSIKVLIITGSPSPETRPGELREMGFTEEHVLFKPFETSRFEAIIRKYLKETPDGC